MHKLRAALGTLAIVALVAGCGDDGGGGGGGGAVSDREQEYIDAAVSSFDEDEDFPMDGDEAECFAGRFVQIVGVDTFEEAGIEPDDFAAEDFDPIDAGIQLDDEQGQALAGSFEECGISMTELFIASAESDGAEISDDLRSCLEENIDEDAFGQIFAQAFVDPDALESDTPPEEFMTFFLDLASACPELIETSG